VVDRESMGWQSEIQGMLPLVDSDSRVALNKLIKWGLSNGVFHFEGPMMITTAMAKNQDMDKFIDLSGELQAKCESLEC